RVDLGIAVDLGGGGQQEAGALGLGQAQAVVRAQAAHLQGLDGDAEVVDGRGGAGEVEDQVEGPLEVDGARDVVLHEHEVAAREVLDVGDVAGQQVVHPHHREAAVEEQLAEM